MFLRPLELFWLAAADLIRIASSRLTTRSCNRSRRRVLFSCSKLNEVTESRARSATPLLRVRSSAGPETCPAGSRWLGMPKCSSKFRQVSSISPDTRASASKQSISPNAASPAGTHASFGALLNFRRLAAGSSACRSAAFRICSYLACTTRSSTEPIWPVSCSKVTISPCRSTVSCDASSDCSSTRKRCCRCGASTGTTIMGPKALGFPVIAEFTSASSFSQVSRIFLRNMGRCLPIEDMLRSKAPMWARDHLPFGGCSTSWQMTTTRSSACCLRLLMSNCCCFCASRALNGISSKELTPRSSGGMRTLAATALGV
mmetsp:Transcript_75992/g.180796  ORF Transcript_75992/g.180796 Transcript_75992/m.180796 type:complete len:316 (+) Transcript_75992:2191-3138(+)